MTAAVDLASVLRLEPEPLLEAALASAGATLDAWRVDAVHARPGAETSVGYDVTAAGERLYLVATTAEVSEEAGSRIGAVRLDSELGAVTLWRHPADPALPGLAVAADPEELAARIASVTGAPASVHGLEMLVLRPLRRAVLRATVTAQGGTPHGGTTTRYVKVVRPDRAPGLIRRHEWCGLAPRALDLGDGVVLIEQAPGRPLTEHLFRAPDPARVDPDALLAALESLPPRATALSCRRTPTERLGLYADAAVAAGIDEARVRRLASAIAARVTAAPGPVVATHGDFHAANLFLTDGDDPAPAGLIDVDTLGPGFRVDDLACMLAHLLALIDLDPDGYRAVPAFAGRVRARFREVGGAELPPRTAAVLLSIAGGIADPRLADAWLCRAEAELGVR